jgi:NADPH2:quinone reductase
VTDQNDIAGLRKLLDLVASGEIRVPIDRTYPLEAIAAAHRYAETGQKEGHIVISV